MAPCCRWVWGAVPDAILRLLFDRRDLGVHSGMLGDGLVDLAEAGVLTNAKKSIDPGISITGALIGTRRLYDFVDRNKAVSMRSSAIRMTNRYSRGWKNW